MSRRDLHRLHRRMIKRVKFKNSIPDELLKATVMRRPWVVCEYLELWSLAHIFSWPPYAVLQYAVYSHAV